MGDAQEKDIAFMREALALAARGAGTTAPNPMVGCILVKDGKVVGSGWHVTPGKAHAEVNALLDAGERAEGATAYVTLEPCNHTGSTGPCTEALIDAGVAEVVYALADANPIAAGGATRLLTAGVKVRAGVCADEARELNRAWVHSLKHKRPYVIGKTAMSLDGRISTVAGQSKWITGEISRARAHQLRKFANAIVVGVETVIADDPALTARIGDETHHPLRVVIDSTGRTPPGSKVYERIGKGALLATTARTPQQRLTAYQDMGVDTVVLDADANGRPDLRELLAALHERGVLSVLIEGGGQVLGSFFDADLIEELHLFIAPKLIGGGKPAFGGRGVEKLSLSERFLFSEPQQLGDDMLWRGVRRMEAR